MSGHDYKWKRFWCPRGGSIDLSDQGYLVDPDSKWAKYVNAEVLSFEDIAKKRCLALLGEPGIGKSKALAMEQENLLKRADAENRILEFDLRSFGSEDRFIREVFEGDAVQEWKRDNSQLYLFLDSLDEGLVRTGVLATIIAEQVRRLPVERLHLYMACRTAEWPTTTLETQLERLFRDQFGAYELVPLRRQDVQVAAETEGIDPGAFLQEVFISEAVPLAIKPITLKFLMNLYGKKKGFPKSRGELYEQGCRILCEEPNVERIEAGLKGSLDAESRLLIAGRIAAVTMFSKKFAVWTGPNLGDVPEEDVTLGEMTGVEDLRGKKTQVDEEAIREVLGTGLFSARGQKRMGWAHQTYAEFLAAWHLGTHKVPIQQVKNLISHPDEPKTKIIPQLAESAAWLASMVSEVFHEIAENDPEVALRSDVLSASEQDRQKLVGVLLDAFEKETLFDTETQTNYSKLNHPNLASQLRPYILDTQKGWLVRRAAIDIAEACGCTELRDELAEIAVRASEPMTVRTNAASAIARIGDDQSKVKLKVLLKSGPEEDPDDELKGLALRALWPKLLPAKELFESLTPSKRTNLIGVYRVFLGSDLPESLRPVDLVPALEWLQERRGERLERAELVSAIMLLAWYNLDLPGVLDAFVPAVLSRLRQHEAIVESDGDDDQSKAKSFYKDLDRNDAKRRRIVEKILPNLNKPEDAYLLVSFRSQLVRRSDIPWLVEHLKHEANSAVRQVIARAMNFVFTSDPETVSVVFHAMKGVQELADELKPAFEPVILGTPHAERLKAEFLQIQELQKPRVHKPVDPPPQIRIATLLDQFEGGRSSAWWQLNREMALEPDSEFYGEELESDLTSLPGWKASADATRERIVSAAQKYLLGHSPTPQEWLGTKIFHRPDHSGYRALKLLLRSAPGTLEKLEPEVWKKWAAVVLAYPISIGIDDDKSDGVLAGMAYLHAPEEVIKALMILMDEDNAEHSEIFITRKLEGCWDERLSRAILERIKRGNLKPSCMGSLLETLLCREYPDAVDFAKSLVTSQDLASEDNRQHAIVAGPALLEAVPKIGWEILWPRIESDSDFGRELVESFAYRHHNRGRFCQALDEEHLARFLVWLAKAYPFTGDYKSGFMGPTDCAKELRDTVLDQLVSRGTWQSVRALQRAVEELPEFPFLKWHLINARKIAHSRTWRPPSPKDVLATIHTSDSRLVLSSHQLVDVLGEAFQTIQIKLRGEVPEAQFLWNKLAKHCFRPKEENELSDFLKNRLDELLRGRGIVTNREVQIHRGQKTDIHVNAVGKTGTEEFETFTAIIEVKGCWNPELLSAMKDQVLDRYLKDNACQCGLYVVVWFDPEGWDAKDHRQNSTAKLSKAEVTTILGNQAKELTRDGIRLEALILDASISKP